MVSQAELSNLLNNTTTNQTSSVLSPPPKENERERRKPFKTKTTFQREASRRRQKKLKKEIQQPRHAYIFSCVSNFTMFLKVLSEESGVCCCFRRPMFGLTARRRHYGNVYSANRHNSCAPFQNAMEGLSARNCLHVDMENSLPAVN